MTKRTASDVLAGLQPDLPVKPASESEMLNPDTMRAHAAQQDQQLQQDQAQRNADGSPIKLGEGR